MARTRPRRRAGRHRRLPGVIRLWRPAPPGHHADPAAAAVLCGSPVAPCISSRRPWASPRGSSAGGPAARCPRARACGQQPMANCTTQKIPCTIRL